MKKAGSGYPSPLWKMALYPAVQAFRHSRPVICITTQSAASMNRSVAAYNSGASSSTCQILGNIHSELIFPPYRAKKRSPRRAAAAFSRFAWSWAAWCFHSLT